MGYWGPDNRQAAVSFTFDNLGEAADLQAGRLDASAPVGSDPSATVSVPAILAELDRVKTSVTFFVEAWNLEVYPAAVESIAEAGHALGNHGWRHELWAELSAERERELFDSVTAAYADRGISLRGFRPPGGKLRPETTSVAAGLGYTYVSPLSIPTGMLDGLAVLPVDINGTDTAYYSERFTSFRTLDAGPHTTGTDVLVEGFLATVDAAVEAGASVSLVCHPMFYAREGQPDAERIWGIGEVIRRLAADDRIWFAQLGEIAAWMQAHPDSANEVTSLQAPSWWRPEDFYRENESRAGEGR